MDQIKIGNFITLLRKERKLTQQELAEKIGVSDKSISKWERGICLPEASTIETLINFFDISLVEFYNGEKESNKIGNNKKKIKTTKHKNVVTYIMISFLMIVLIIYLIFLLNTYDKYSSYRIVSTSNDYTGNGTLNISKEKGNITLMNLTIIDDNIYNIISRDFECYLHIDDVLIFHSGDIYDSDSNKIIKLGEYAEKLSIYIDNDLNTLIEINNLTDRILELSIKYLDSNLEEKEYIMKFKFIKLYSSNN